MDQVISGILHLATKTAGLVITVYPPRLNIGKPVIFGLVPVFVIGILMPPVAASVDFDGALLLTGSGETLGALQTPPSLSDGVHVRPAADMFAARYGTQ
jgi:hypothetical protein